MLRVTILTVSLLSVVFSAALAGPIHDAASGGDLAQVQSILKDDPGQVQVRDDRNNTPLHLAALNGHLEVVQYLLDQGAEIDAGDNENSTPLANAGLRGHLEIARLLLERGASPTITDDFQLMPIHFAAMGGNVEIIKLLLERGAEVEVRSTVGATPLMYAVGRRHAEATRLLIERGADVNTCNDRGYSVLAVAVYGGSAEICRLFIDGGVDINSLDSAGQTPLMLAAGRGHSEVVELLVASGAQAALTDPNGWTALQLAALSGNTASIRALIGLGLEINTVDSAGNTPLMCTAWREHDSAAVLLLANGADPSIADTSGVTPLLSASRAGYSQVVKALLDAGAQPDAKDRRYGRTALHHASIRGFTDIAEALVAAGADLNMVDNNGQTALHYAGQYSNPTIADLLMTNGGAGGMAGAATGRSDLLDKSIDAGQAVVWYLGHSAWAVKTQDHLLIFDYAEFRRGPDDPWLANGSINPEEIKDKKVVAFTTHSHGDHWGPEIMQWRETIPDIQYVMGFTPDSVTGFEYIPAHEHRTLGDVEVSTIAANDGGCGFVIEVDGLVLFHGADHANNDLNIDSTFAAEIEYIAAMNKSIDIAFMGITGCSLGRPPEVKAGVIYAMEQLKPKMLFPQHTLGHEYRYRDFADEAADRITATKIMCAENKGDRFIYPEAAPVN